MMMQRDWFAILKAQLDAEPIEPPPSPAKVESLIDDIVSGRIEAPVVRRSRATRRRWIAGGTVVVLLGGGATAAALWNRTKPAYPHVGVACHASAQIRGVVEVIPVASDPGGACAQLWLAGKLPNAEDGGPPADVAPAQFACVGPGGTLEVFPVFPNRPSTCADLGLVDADTNLTRDPLVLLQDRLTNEINLVCVDEAAAQRLIHTALGDTGLGSWAVIVREGTAGCVFAIEDPDTKTVILITNPTQSTTP